MKSFLLISVNLFTPLLVIMVVGCSRSTLIASPNYEIAVLTALAEPDSTATPIMVRVTPTPYLDYWVPYTNAAYAVSLEYPVNWSETHTGPEDEQGPVIYSGDNGFFAIQAVDGTSLDEIVSNEVHHKELLYGSHPSVETVELKGQTWLLIMPSADQSTVMSHQTAMITRYPKTVTISGITYKYYILRADFPHIRTIAETVTFLEVY